MPELPEIYILAEQMQAALPGKTISDFEIIQPKCLNTEPEDFITALQGATIQNVTYHGKWISVETDQGWLFLCLGMGGEILLVDRGSLPEKYRIIIDFTDDATGSAPCLAINFWWFGYVHYAAELSEHDMTARLGPNALDISPDEFQNMLSGRRGKIKTWLLDQSKIAGIGNFYIHDILYNAKIHPLRAIPSLDETEIVTLYTCIQEGLKTSISKGGSAYEQNLHGKKGTFGMDDLLIAYKENQPCPVCGTKIQKIKTGSTSGFVCTYCQPI